MKEHFKLLGYVVRDVVTGTKGVVTSISFDLSGCVQGLVALKTENKLDESRWFDIKRLERLEAEPVMPVPVFEIVPGSQDLPGYESKPAS